ncbi:hypothetical protein [Methylomonas fluvii]|nr:hypothetical protein [Methylomonas fluvii]
MLLQLDGNPVDKLLISLKHSVVGRVRFERTTIALKVLYLFITH